MKSLVAKVVGAATSATHAAQLQQVARRTLGGDEAAAAASGTSGTVTLDCSTGSVFTLTPTGDVTTLNLSNPPASGRACTITLIVSQGATTRTIATPSGGSFFDGATPTPVANKKTVYTYMTTDGGSSWLCWASQEV